MTDDDIDDPDDVDEAGSVIDSAHELIDDASLVNNLPVEEANFPIQAALNGHNASQRRTNLQQQLATNPIGAQYNMDALLPQRNVERHDMGTMSVTCSYCNATGFAKERKKQKNRSVNLGRLCCNGGTSMFNNFPDLPDDLMNLYTGTDETAKNFQKKVRFFNAGMAMASMQVVNDQTIKKHGPGVFRIANVLYRRIGSITAPQGCTDTKCVHVGTLPNGYTRTAPLPRLRTDTMDAHQGRTVRAQSHPSVTAQAHQRAQAHSTIRSRPTIQV